MKLLALIKKEFRRFFHDPRLLLTVVLPGLFIFALYSVIGSAISGNATYEYNVYVVGQSQVVSAIEATVKESGSTVRWLNGSEEEARKAIEERQADACLVFSDQFDTAASGAQVELIYDLSNEKSSAFSSVASPVLHAYGMRFSFVATSVTDEQNFGREVIANMIPVLVVAFVFSACMSVTLESVAGEKERGTLGTILATSVKRSQIALGKVIPLSCIAALGAASSFLGVMLSMPKLMGMNLATVAGSYGFVSYLFIFLLILSFVPLIVSAVTAVSTYSRTVKEASGYTSVIMILVMVVSLVTSFISAGDWFVAVPVLNSVLAIEAILRGNIMVWQTLVSVAANIVYTALLVLLIARMFSSERIMFRK